MNCKCDDCKFFVPCRKVSLLGKPLPVVDGQCRRFPPIHPQSMSGFPEVKVGMWCGEYEHKNTVTVRDCD